MPASPDPPPSRLAAELDRWRFLLFGRIVPGALFAFLGYLQLGSVLAGPDHQLPQAAQFAQSAGSALYLAFVCLPVGIYVVRPRPQARDGRVIARIAAFIGTLILVSVPSAPGSALFSPPGWLFYATTALIAAGYALAVWGLLYLRQSFSIIPEARRVVSGGPYRVIRHPLYSAEIVVGLCGALQHPKAAALAVLPIFIVAQLVRSVFEERLLEGTFPEYGEYRRRTWRMIPFVM
jgi:protein-S-isoprenylcysteine O-methyltransferase Ste14